MVIQFSKQSVEVNIPKRLPYYNDFLNATEPLPLNSTNPHLSAGLHLVVHMRILHIILMIFCLVTCLKILHVMILSWK